MHFLEYGNQNNKAIILIHGYGISWKMWLPQIDFFSKDYYVIIPILNGHHLENSSTFTTVEQAVTDIIDYVKEYMVRRYMHSVVPLLELLSG